MRPIPEARHLQAGLTPHPVAQQKNMQKVLGDEQRHPETLLSPPQGSQMASELPAHGATWALLWEILGYPEMTNMW